MDLCSIFVNIIFGFFILTENTTVVNVVPAGTDTEIVFRALERCLLYLSCNLFLHKILFRLVRMVYLVAGSLLTSPPLSLSL